MSDAIKQPATMDTTASSPNDASNRVDVVIRDLCLAYYQPSLIPSFLQSKKSNTTATTATIPNTKSDNTHSSPSTVNKTVDETRSDILFHISASTQGGRLVAIMGGSGSGKTSLLDVMATRTRPSATCSIEGEVLLNGFPLSASDTASSTVGYVAQHDYLMPYLTVRETLRYAAALRMPAGTPVSVQHERVEQVILELGLKECADTRIGDDVFRGISGGEKRRTSVGLQLINDPRVLLCDEPTSSLDAFSAYNVIELLSRIAKTRNRSIFVTIHQPRSDIFELFDDIWVLAKGHLVYAGPAVQMVPYFANLGLPCPEHTNPADFVLDVTSIDNRDSETEDRDYRRLRALVKSWSRHSAQQCDDSKLGTDGEQAPGCPSSGPVVMSKTVAEQPRQKFVALSAFKQFFVLFGRSFTNTRRDMLNLVGGLLECIIMSVVLGAMFYQLDESQAGIRSRMYALYMSIGLQTYVFMIFCIQKMCKDLLVFDRERKDSMYGVIPYVLSDYLMTVLPYSLFSFIFCLIYYNMAGLRPGWESHFWVFTGINIMSMWVSAGLAFACAAAYRSFALASLLGNSMFTFITLSCGIFVQSDTLPPYVAWLQYVSFIFYSMRALLTNEYTDRKFTCPANAVFGCDPYDGNRILKSFGFERDDYDIPAVALACFIVGLVLITMVVLYFVKPQVRVTASSRQGLEVGKEEVVDVESAARLEEILTMNSLPHLNTAADLKGYSSGDSSSVLIRGESDSQVPGIELRNITLRAHRKFHSSDAEMHTTILDDVSLKIRRGRLLCILGSSGCGKTSILNVISRRWSSSMFTKLSLDGHVLFDGEVVNNPDRMRSLCSYVMQSDQLLPLLTVRETLHFAALLRLPDTMTHAEKIARAEDVLLSVGLKDCADTKIGNELVRGVSGGERRRTSIAIGILANPPVLLADEVTSSLDSYTAHNIVLLLKQVATQGKTVICSLHQPRSDLFSLFDDILVMGKGGRVVYYGSSFEMVSYFDSLGHRCPTYVNPADFVIDISSIDYRSVEAEKVSQDRLNSLVTSYREHSAVDKSVVKVSDVHALTSVDISDVPTVSTEKGHPAGMRQAPFWVAFPLLIKRSVMNLVRQPELCIARVFQGVSFAIILSLFFAPLGDDYYSVQNRIGILQEITALLFIGMLNAIAVYIPERNVFYREEADGAYPMAAFFWSYAFNEVPFEIMTCILYSVFMGPVCGLRYDGVRFPIMCFMVFAVINVGESIGILFCSLVYHVGFSVTLMNLVLSLATVTAGLMTVDFPAVVDAFNRISVLPYVAKVLVKNEFEGMTFTCTKSQLVAGGICPLTTGEQVLSLYKMDSVNVAENMLIIACMVVGYRLLSLLVLWIRSSMHGSGGK
jgi:ABC-type multidrug transport system ATPase subunit